MKKTILAIAAICLLGGAALALFWLFAPSDQTDGGTPAGPLVEKEVPVEVPASSSGAGTTRQSVKEKILSGGIQTEPSGASNMLVIDEYPKSEAPSVVPDYTTLYFKDSDAFLIELYAFPLMDTRERAQRYLFEKLGITSAQACDLAVEVRVNSSISASLAGQDLGMSVCPGSLDLSAYRENTDGIGTSE